MESANRQIDINRNWDMLAIVVLWFWNVVCFCHRKQSHAELCHVVVV